MRHPKLLAALFAASLGFTSVASAISFSDTDGSPTWLSHGGSVNGWLNITAGQPVNFNPATMTITGAEVWFAFADTFEPGRWNPGPDSTLEYVTVKLDSSVFLHALEVDGTHLAYDWTSASGALSGSFLASLQTDGKLAYNVQVVQGDVWFKGAKLEATAEYKRTPDSGATAAMLLLGLTAVAAFSRRR